MAWGVYDYPDPPPGWMDEEYPTPEDEEERFWEQVDRQWMKTTIFERSISITCNENTVLVKKLERASSYSTPDGIYDLTCDQELRVTITLAEYRALVSSVATRDADVKKAETDKYSREQENKRLAEENAKLKAELYEMNKKAEVLSASVSDLTARLNKQEEVF